MHSGVHTLQRPPPAAAQLCPMGLTLVGSNIYYSTSNFAREVDIRTEFYVFGNVQTAKAELRENVHVHVSTENMRLARVALCAAVRRESK